MIRIAFMLLMLNNPIEYNDHCINAYERLQAHEPNKIQRDYYSDKITEIKKHSFEIAWRTFCHLK